MKAECSVARSVRRQGERSEMRRLLLCAVPEVTEWKECSERGRRNDWNEVTVGTWNINRNLKALTKGKCIPEIKCKGFFCRGVHMAFQLSDFNPPKNCET